VVVVQATLTVRNIPIAILLALATRQLCAGLEGWVITETL